MQYNHSKLAEIPLLPKASLLNKEYPKGLREQFSSNSRIRMPSQLSRNSRMLPSLKELRTIQDSGSRTPLKLHYDSHQQRRNIINKPLPPPSRFAERERIHSPLFLDSSKVAPPDLGRFQAAAATAQISPRLQTCLSMSESDEGSAHSVDEDLHIEFYNKCRRSLLCSQPSSGEEESTAPSDIKGARSGWRTPLDQGSSLPIQTPKPNPEIRKTIISKLAPFPHPQRPDAPQPSPAFDRLKNDGNDSCHEEDEEAAHSLRPTAASPPRQSQSLLWKLDTPHLRIKDLAVTKKSKAPFLRTALLASRKRSQALNKDLQVVAVPSPIAAPPKKGQTQKEQANHKPEGSKDLEQLQKSSNLPALSSTSRNTLGYERRKSTFRTFGGKPSDRKDPRQGGQHSPGSQLQTFNLADLEIPSATPILRKTMVPSPQFSRMMSPVIGAGGRQSLLLHC